MTRAYNFEPGTSTFAQPIVDRAHQELLGWNGEDQLD
jgi:hypothetical protein